MGPPLARGGPGTVPDRAQELLGARSFANYRDECKRCTIRIDFIMF